ncbi:MAG: NUDIX hydrolase [bacterium]
MSNEHFIADIPVKAWIRKGEEVLMVKESDGRWTFPGGRMHGNESPRDALAREMKEEVGLDVTAGDVLDCFPFTSASGQHHFVVIFEASLVDDDQVPVLDKKEVTEYKWMNLSDFEKYKVWDLYHESAEKLFKMKK